jgi:hypothetical protein
LHFRRILNYCSFGEEKEITRETTTDLTEFTFWVERRRAGVLLKALRIRACLLLGRHQLWLSGLFTKPIDFWTKIFIEEHTDATAPGHPSFLRSRIL